MVPFTDIKEEDELLSQRVDHAARQIEGEGIEAEYEDEDEDDDEEYVDEEYEVDEDSDEDDEEDGDGDEEDEEESEEEINRRREAEEAEAEEAERKKKSNVFWLLISGNVLVLSGLTKYYWQMIIIASIFLLSIIITFWSLHLDLEYNNLARDVQLLREKSIRMKEMRFTRCSQSAIIEELERRNIDLINRTTPTTVIDDKSFWK